MGEKCKFCENFVELKKIENHFSERALSENLVYLYEYTAAIVTHSWYGHKGRKNAGRVVTFMWMKLLSQNKKGRKDET